MRLIFLESGERPLLATSDTLMGLTDVSHSQTIVHYGWIPTILVVAWRASNPRPPIMRSVWFLFPLLSHWVRQPR